MRLYNTLSRSEEAFTPGPDNTVRMYTCGLTVYARGHIGNFRTFVCLDVLRRTLRHLLGYEVRQVMNFTDVDDRTIAGADERGHGPAVVHRSVHRDVPRGCAGARPRAGGGDRRAPPIRRTSRRWATWSRALDRSGHTYRSNGSVYFKIATLPDYGKLARLDHEGMHDGARVDSDNYDKEDARDFVLWKATKPGEPTWDVVDPPGRPGWHLECSAMALRLLGEPPIDIHAGGIDLDLSASRERDRAERRRDRQAVLALLGPRRVSARRRPEDVEVARQHLHGARSRRRRATGRRRCATCCCRRTIASS